MQLLERIWIYNLKNKELPLYNKKWNAGMWKE
jgi:hypothetical protein